MAVRIRLLRMGKIRNPQYRIVVADSRTKRDGRTIENLGIYHPKEEPSRIEVNSERVQYWLSVGAQPSEPVRAILRKTGDWQKFKGEPPPAEPLKTAPPKADRTAIYEAEAKAAAGLADAPGKGEAATPKKSGKKAAKKEADAPKGEAAKDAKGEASTDTAAGGDQAAAPTGDAGEQS
ncbi:MAG TPA: 30S ribosomal protein S16 [Natronosporangium sp.]|nr:30S ribosomal protein S16 [Natronosporangium sp.]